MTNRPNQRPSTRPLLVIAVLIAAAGAVVVAAHDHKRPPAAAPRLTTSAHPHQQLGPRPSIAACPGATSDIDRLLPFDHRGLRAAIQLAARFATAYATRTRAASYLQQLKPLVTPSFYRDIARDTAATGVAHHTNARLRTARARAIGPTSVIVVATATLTPMASTAGTGTRGQTLRLAITVTATHPNEPLSRERAWIVNSVQPAADGDTGDSADGDGP